MNPTPPKTLVIPQTLAIPKTLVIHKTLVILSKAKDLLLHLQLPALLTRASRLSFAALILVMALALSPTKTQAQGCTQCRDNTAATPPQTQAAYRHAIILLAVTASGFFIATLTALRRHR
jgi:hypothetical protein